MRTKTVRMSSTRSPALPANETICLSEDILLKGEMDCPNCGENLEFDFDGLCDDDDGCDCGCHDKDGHEES